MSEPAKAVSNVVAAAQLLFMLPVFVIVAVVWVCLCRFAVYLVWDLLTGGVL